MDVMAGRACHQEVIFGVKVVDRVSETALMRMYRELVGEPPQPVWCPASGVTRDFRGRGARWDTGYGYVRGSLWLMVGQVEKNGLFTREAKRAVILKFLSLLQRDEPSPASLYASKVFELSRSLSGYVSYWLPEMHSSFLEWPIVLLVSMRRAYAASPREKLWEAAVRIQDTSTTHTLPPEPSTPPPRRMRGDEASGRCASGL
jgi:hypothetical protein